MHDVIRSCGGLPLFRYVPSHTRSHRLNLETRWPTTGRGVPPMGDPVPHDHTDGASFEDAAGWLFPTIAFCRVVIPVFRQQLTNTQPAPDFHRTRAPASILQSLTVVTAVARQQDLRETVHRPGLWYTLGLCKSLPPQQSRTIGLILSEISPTSCSVRFLDSRLSRSGEG
jgi:hypothetical protein